MTDIRKVIDEIGVEVDRALDKKQKSKYLYLSMLLYSLIENFLKWLVATQILWNETGKQTEAEMKGQAYQVDWDSIRKKAARLDFNTAIDKAFTLGLIGIRLKKRLHNDRLTRNDLVHELWIYKRRNDEEFMRAMLGGLKATTIKLVHVFGKLVYGEIGVDVPEMFTLLKGR